MNALLDAAYANLGNASLVLTMADELGDLTFWDAASGGNQLSPTGVDNVLETLTIPNSGSFSGKLWIENDTPPTVQVDPSCTILAQVLPPPGGAGAAVQAQADATTIKVGDVKIVSATYTINGFYFTAKTGAGAELNIAMGKKPADTWGQEFLDYAVKVADALSGGLPSKVKQVAHGAMIANLANVMITEINIGIVVSVKYEYKYCTTAGYWRKPWFDGKVSDAAVPLGAEGLPNGGDLLSAETGRQAILLKAKAALADALKALGNANLLQNAVKGAIAADVTTKSGCSQVTEWPETLTLK